VARKEASEAQRHPSIGLAPAEEESAISEARGIWENPTTVRSSAFEG
jgi:hypothetical protein